MPVYNPAAPAARSPRRYALAPRDPATGLVAPQDSQIVRGLRAGLDNLSASGAGLEAIGHALVNNAPAAQASAQQAQQFQKDAQQFGPDVATVSEVHGIDSFGKWLAGQVGQQAIGLAPMVVGGLAAPAIRGVAGAILPKVVSAAIPAAITSSTAGAVAGASAAAAGTLYPTLQADPTVRKNYTPRERALTAIGGGLAMGTAGVLPFVRLTKRFGVEKAAEHAITTSLSKAVAKGAITQSAIQAGAAGAQTIAERAAHKFLNNNADIFSPEGMRQLRESISSGGLLGLTIGAGGGVVHSVLGHAAPAASLDAHISKLQAGDQLGAARVRGVLHNMRQRFAGNDKVTGEINNVLKGDMQNPGTRKDATKFSHALAEVATTEEVLQEAGLLTRMHRNQASVDRQTSDVMALSEFARNPELINNNKTVMAVLSKRYGGASGDITGLLDEIRQRLAPVDAASTESTAKAMTATGTDKVTGATTPAPINADVNKSPTYISSVEYRAKKPAGAAFKAADALTLDAANEQLGLLHNNDTNIKLYDPAQREVASGNFSYTRVPLSEAVVEMAKTGHTRSLDVRDARGRPTLVAPILKSEGGKVTSEQLMATVAKRIADSKSNKDINRAFGDTSNYDAGVVARAKGLAVSAPKEFLSHFYAIKKQALPQDASPIIAAHREDTTITLSKRDVTPTNDVNVKKSIVRNIPEGGLSGVRARAEAPLIQIVRDAAGAAKRSSGRTNISVNFPSLVSKALTERARTDKTGSQGYTSLGNIASGFREGVASLMADHGLVIKNISKLADSTVVFFRNRKVQDPTTKRWSNETVTLGDVRQYFKAQVKARVAKPDFHAGVEGKSRATNLAVEDALNNLFEANKSTGGNTGFVGGQRHETFTMQDGQRTIDSKGAIPAHTLADINRPAVETFITHMLAAQGVKKEVRVTRIISGGQTGADMGGLAAGRALGLDTGGTAPPAFITENGPNAQLRDVYKLTASSAKGYAPRTKDNIINSDGTVILSAHVGSPGTRLTIAMAKSEHKPYLLVDLSTTDIASATKNVKAFLHDNSIETLNVAGNRESVVPGIQRRAATIIHRALAHNKGDAVRTRSPAGLATRASTKALARATHTAHEAFSKRLGLADTNIMDTAQAIVFLRSHGMSHLVGLDKNGREIVKPETGGFADGNNVFINPLLSSAEQVETLGHEIGHVVFARHVNEQSPGTVKLINRAYATWLSERKITEATLVSDILKNKSPLHLMLRELGGGDRFLSALTRADRQYLLDSEEWFADNTAKFLVTDAVLPKNAVDRFFKGLVQKLRAVFAGFNKNPDKVVADVLRTIQVKAKDRVLSSAKDSMVKQVGKYIKGIKMSRKTRRTLLDGESIVAYLATHSVYSDTARAAIGDWMQVAMTAEERLILTNAFKVPHVRDKIEAITGSMAAAAKESLATGVQLWVMGKIDLGSKSNSVLGRVTKLISDFIGLQTNEKNAKAILHALLRSKISELPEERTFALRDAYRKDILARATNALYKQAVWAAGPIKAYTFTADSRMQDIPALQKIAQLVHARVGLEAGVPTTYTEGVGMQSGAFASRLTDILAPLSTEQKASVLEHAQGGYVSTIKPAEQAAVSGLRTLFDDMYTYASRAGVKVSNKKAGKGVFAFLKNYFPVVYDVQYLMAHRDDFIHMLEQGKYSARMASGGLSPERLYTHMIENMGYSDTPLSKSAAFTPNMSAVNVRTLDWIEPADRAPFLSKNLEATTMRYVDSVVKRAEYTKRFGNNGEVITKLLHQAMDAGMSAKQLAMANNYLRAAFGTLGQETNSKLYALFGKVAPPGEVINPLLQHAMSATIVFRNMAVLGLSALTSLSDVVGITVRSGDLQSSFAAYKQGMKEIQQSVKNIGITDNEKGATMMAELASGLGIMDRHLTNEALEYEFGGAYMSARLKKYNEMFFNAIGMTQLTRLTRVMALAAAKNFIKMHGDGAYAHSARFMDELGLKKGDVVMDSNNEVKVLTHAERAVLIKQIDANTPAAKEADINNELARDDRVRTALYRWVDGAILRPNAEQRPIWASDPNYMLFFHLKSFTYSMHDRILRRVWTELADHNNLAPAAALMLYVPAMMAIDVARDWLKYGLSGSPRKANWSFFDYAGDAINRAGIPGVAGSMLIDAQTDRKFGGIGLESQTGAVQYLNTLSEGVLSGNTYEIEHTLPASSIWQSWHVGK